MYPRSQKRRRNRAPCGTQPELAPKCLFYPETADEPLLEEFLGAAFPRGSRGISHPASVGRHRAVPESRNAPIPRGSDCLDPRRANLSEIARTQGGTHPGSLLFCRGKTVRTCAAAGGWPNKTPVLPQPHLRQTRQILPRLSSRQAAGEISRTQSALPRGIPPSQVPNISSTLRQPADFQRAELIISRRPQ